MRYNNKFSELGGYSVWNGSLGWQLTLEIERLDKANKRKRKALKQMTKALEKRNKEIEELKECVKQLEKEVDGLNDWIEELL